MLLGVIILKPGNFFDTNTNMVSKYSLANGGIDTMYDRTNQENAATIIDELKNKINDIKQLQAEDKKLNKVLDKNLPLALWGKITIKDKKYKQFASKMIAGKRERVYLGNDKVKIAEYQERIDKGALVDATRARKEQIARELNNFYLRLFVYM